VAAQVVHAFAQDIQRATLFDLIGQTFQEAFLGLLPVLQLQLLPGLCLRRVEELEERVGVEAEGAVVGGVVAAGVSVGGQIADIPVSKSFSEVSMAEVRSVGCGESASFGSGFPYGPSGRVSLHMPLVEIVQRPVQIPTQTHAGA
jgi:hypothetical protein